MIGRGSCGRLHTFADVELGFGIKAYISVDKMCAKADIERGHGLLAFEVADNVFSRMQPLRAAICNDT